MDVNDYRPAYGSVFFLTGVYTAILFLFIGVWIQSPPCRNCFLNFYANVYIIIPLLGAILGFYRLKNLQHPLVDPRRFAPTMFCIGILMWSFGGMVWSLYNVWLKVEIPYPSWADVGYFSNLVFWTAGIFAMYGISRTNPFQEIATPLPLALALSGGIAYVMLSAHGGILDPSGNVLKVFLDVGYPIVGTFNLALVVAFIFGPSASLAKCVPAMRWATYIICAGTFFNLVADFTFNFTTTLPASNPLAYYNGSGTDFMYATAFYLLSIGVLLFPLSNS